MMVDFVVRNAGWKARTPMSDECTKCKGTGWYPYDYDNSKKCDYCCDHSEGWWVLSENYYGYKEGQDNRCCLKGCGTMFRDLGKENKQ